VPAASFADPPDDAPDIVPVTLLTGFLGSGKSTLLSRILRDPRFSDTAVVVNEFGEVGLDGFLVEHSSEQTVEMTTGCLCCTIRGDIRQTLLRLHDRRTRGEIPAFERLIVETTGLADPAPVVHTLIADASLSRRYALSGIVTTVDALAGAATLDRQAECVKQAAIADRIVLTKTDLAAGDDEKREVGELRRSLARLNPGARILDRNTPGFDLRALFDTALFDPLSRPAEVRRWLNAEAFADEEAHDHNYGHGHDHDHRHDVNRHGPDIHAFCVKLDEPVSIMAFTVALELLVANQGEDLLRVKGIVSLKERPDRPVVIHGVQHVLHEPVWLEAWPDADRRTKIVFVTRNIRKETIEAFFEAWRKAGDDGAAAALSRP
jgi:G3E family GTPase